MSECTEQRFGVPRGFRRAGRRAVCFFVAFSYMLCALAAVLTPAAPGDTVYTKKGTTVDASNASQGYIMVKQKPTDKKLKLRVSLGDDTLTYDLNSNGEYEVFPLQLGSGKYKVQVFSQISGTRYNTVSSLSFQAELENELLPFLYPNQYVNFSENSAAVAKANELCQGLSTDEDKFKAVYQYTVSHMVYDYMLALTVQSNYLPDVDTTLSTGKGICFDFAALVASMLRSQGIPTQLVIGYADQTYHAWNLVFYGGNWLRCDPTAAICGTNVQSYTTERFY